MARDYGAEYERRQELAEERGFGSFYDMRSSLESVRDRYESLDFDDRLTVAQFEYDYTDGDMSRDELRAFFDDNIGGDDDAFYDWLQSLYE